MRGVRAGASAILVRMQQLEHRTTEQLEAGLDDVRNSPKNNGEVALIVARPAVGERTVVDVCELDLVAGLVGDNWSERVTSATPDGSPDPDRQLTIMNARAAALFAVDPDRRALAGDQLYLDLDLSGANLPAGTRLRLGDAVIEITAAPHTGCAKFRARFGADALRFVNSVVGRELNLRGVNAKIVVAGRLSVGDVARKYDGAA